MERQGLRSFNKKYRKTNQVATSIETLHMEPIHKTNNTIFSSHTFLFWCVFRCARLHCFISSIFSNILFYLNWIIVVCAHTREEKKALTRSTGKYSYVRSMGIKSREMDSASVCRVQTHKLTIGEQKEKNSHEA